MNLISGLRIMLPAVFLIIIMQTFAQDDFYDISTIQEIEISFVQSNWDYILDTAKAGSGSYLMSQWVKINGVQYDSAGVKYKGSSSYDPSFIKNPLHISLDEFKNQSHLGYTSIKLANFYGDPSMIREPLAYSILANYMDCPKSNFAKVTINGAYIGLYANDESVNKKFCSTHFYSSGNTFIKGSPILPGPFSKSNLKYTSADSSSYFGKYELESEYGWNDLAELCDIITNLPSALSTKLDIDRVLWMLAFNNVLVNLDSYSGWFAQNHYLYKDNTGHYNPVIWDLNMSFGGFPFAGTQNGGSGALTVNDMKQMDPLLHDAHSDWPLIMNILANPQWKRMYLAHMKTIVYENFYFENYLEQAEMMQTLIDQSVLADANKFFTYEQFQQGLWTDVTFGSYVIPAIDGLMAERSGFLQSTDVFPDNTVLFGGVWTEEQFPEPGQVVNMMANVVTLTGEGDLRVYLGVRHDKKEKFVLNEMFDDGNHNDGEAGDHVYGASFTMTTLTAQYYAYAEIDEANNFSACFSPERAEHEFYTLNAVVPTAQPGDVAINEFLAKNTSDTTNEYGNYEDWIEIYNLTG
jgi:spore coat protein CotH